MDRARRIRKNKQYEDKADGHAQIHVYTVLDQIVYLGDLRRRATLLARAIKRDAVLGLSLRNNGRMTPDSGKYGRWRRRRIGRQHHDSWRSNVIRALFVDRPEGALLHPRHIHHAVMLAVSSAAHRHTGLDGALPKEGQDRGYKEQREQRAGKQASHIAIMPDDQDVKTRQRIWFGAIESAWPGQRAFVLLVAGVIALARLHKGIFAIDC